ncbi:MAG: HupE/UreJ family protein [Saprospiraceae bacterium]
MKKITSVLIIFLFVPLVSYAHGSYGGDFIAGFTHPIFGIDHNIAIIGTALLGYLLDKKKWYLFSLSFLTLMIVGGIVGIGQDDADMIETIIVISSIAIGLKMTVDIHLNKSIILGLIAVIGFFHGYAHGVEMPAETAAFKYISGFSVAVVLMSLIAWLISRWLARHSISRVVYKFIGGIMIAYGIIMLIS